MSAVNAQTRVEVIKQINAILVADYGVPFVDVLKDVHGGSITVIDDMVAMRGSASDYVAGLAKDHGLVPGDGRGNAYRCALVAFARDAGWIAAPDGRIYSESSERLVRAGVDDTFGSDRVFVIEVASDVRLDVAEDGFEVPEAAVFTEVCRGLDIGSTVDEMDIVLQPDPGPQPMRHAF